jgi:hypothetical protein
VALQRELADALHDSGLESPEITIETVEQLRRNDGPAKLKRFVPLVNADPHHTGKQALSAAR